jgi:molybdopterin molybdotransferase
MCKFRGFHPYFSPQIVAAMSTCIKNNNIKMISVKEATDYVLRHLYKPTIIAILIEDAVGKILAEPVSADRDFPPFDRVTMDGIAIAFEQWANGRRVFDIEAIQAAGEAQSQLKDLSNAIEVMTGTALPTGTDTVIRYEDLTIGNRTAKLTDTEIVKGQSIHRLGQDAKKGEILLSPGTKLSAAEIALLASVGMASVKVYDFPKAAIVGSGDELVAVNATPEAHQIRRSNIYALVAAMNQLGWPADQFHLRDEKESLTTYLSKLLDDYDVLILSGGVSKGKYDFIPEVLEDLGVRKIFHEVSQRPGKPFWFGVREDKHVFALPGNPVSTFMCFYRYVKPWVFKSLNFNEKPAMAVLAKDFSFPPKLTYFLQVRLENEEGKLMAYPDQGGGSGDFANLKKIDGFLELPVERSDFKAGETFPYIAFRL